MTVHSMTEMMTRFLGLGFTVPQVVTMSTTNPAKAVGLDGRLGTLEAGRQADVSVLELKEGDWMVYDILGAGLRVDRAFAPHVTSSAASCSRRTSGRGRGAGGPIARSPAGAADEHEPDRLAGRRHRRRPEPTVNVVRGGAARPCSCSTTTSAAPPRCRSTTRSRSSSR
jgi:hypothetical protein